MSVIRSRPALRWLVPSAAAVLVIGGGAAAGTLVANAEPTLPERSAAQLLVDVQNAKVDGLSGTVVQRTDLGLPPLSVAGGSDLTKLLGGNTSARVWYAGETQARVALMSTLGQTDVVRNGTDVWVWQSRDNTAVHYRLPAGDREPVKAPTGIGALPSTPQDAAAMALAAIDPTTAVSTSGAAEVAGRPAYELVLAPRDTASLVGQVRLAIDAEEHIPLRVEVYAKGANTPAVRIAFEQISFTKPDAEQFAFNPPPKATVTDRTAPQEQQSSGAKQAKPGGATQAKPGGAAQAKPDDAARPSVIGKGWTSIVTARMPAVDASAGKTGNGTASGDAGGVGSQIKGVLDSLPKVSGAWGSGRLLSGTLFNALLTDDGRVFAGAVAPEKLYEAAGK